MIKDPTQIIQWALNHTKTRLKQMTLAGALEHENLNMYVQMFLDVVKHLVQRSCEEFYMNPYWYMMFLKLCENNKKSRSPRWPWSALRASWKNIQTDELDRIGLKERVVACVDEYVNKKDKYTQYDKENEKTRETRARVVRLLRDKDLGKRTLLSAGTKPKWSEQPAKYNQETHETPYRTIDENGVWVDMMNLYVYSDDSRYLWLFKHPNTLGGCYVFEKRADVQTQIQRINKIFRQHRQNIQTKEPAVWGKGEYTFSGTSITLRVIHVRAQGIDIQEGTTLKAFVGFVRAFTHANRSLDLYLYADLKGDLTIQNQKVTVGKGMNVEYPNY